MEKTKLTGYKAILQKPALPALGFTVNILLARIFRELQRIHEISRLTYAWNYIIRIQNKQTRKTTQNTTTARRPL